MYNAVAMQCMFAFSVCMRVRASAAAKLAWKGLGDRQSFICVIGTIFQATSDDEI